MYPNTITERTGKKSSTKKADPNTDPASSVGSWNMEFSNLQFQTFIGNVAIYMPLNRSIF